MARSIAAEQAVHAASPHVAQNPCHCLCRCGLRVAQYGHGGPRARRTRSLKLWNGSHGAWRRSRGRSDARLASAITDVSKRTAAGATTVDGTVSSVIVTVVTVTSTDLRSGVSGRLRRRRTACLRGTPWPSPTAPWGQRLLSRSR